MKMYDPKTRTLTINNQDFSIEEVYHEKGIYYLKSMPLSFVTDGTRIIRTHTFKWGRPALIRYKRTNMNPFLLSLTVDDSLSIDDMVLLYKVTAGPCVEGIADFLAKKNLEPRLYTISEAIEITRGEYNADHFENYFTAADDLTPYTIYNGIIPNMEPSYVIPKTPDEDLIIPPNNKGE